MRNLSGCGIKCDGSFDEIFSGLVYGDNYAKYRIKRYRWCLDVRTYGIMYAATAPSGRIFGLKMRNVHG